MCGGNHREHELQITAARGARNSGDHFREKVGIARRSDKRFNVEDIEAPARMGLAVCLEREVVLLDRAKCPGLDRRLFLVTVGVHAAFAYPAGHAH